MQYRTDKAGNALSILGYGCMRFTKKGAEIDLDKAEQELMYAIRHGVNYLDTAYVYPGNEEAVGKILAKNNCRGEVYLATKLPHYLIRSASGAQKKFTEELHRLQTDYIDYYLMHMLNDVKTWERLVDQGIGDWIAQKRASGEIRHIGFSYHGNSENFKALLDVYDWDFCQIQYNYLDEHTQAGREGLLYAAEKGIPVIIMEPLRGGRLVNDLPQEAKRLIADAGYTPAGLALAWLWAQPEVTCVLSGMNSLDMVKENIRIAQNAGMQELSPKQEDLIRQVRQEIARSVKVGCTGCGYCMPCPNRVDIPMAFHAYNAKYTEGKKSGRKEYLQSTAMRRETTSASQCIGCGRCEKYCPQGIPIREKLKEAVRELETPSYKIVKWAVQKFHFY
ncbi:aldo/keto reductase [Parablautia sp. Marseille-Q6255]|uniref:aldo/keto reductase n=1 Tax=Parablautia sp. Marseille-Q6255 TaxID=3039593 RepID=UPI0024BC3DCD|nr:aldo/keto reductase [Parablautia sp. Marseille-Q6255]